MYLRCLMFALALVLAACPCVLSRDVQVLAEGYSWLENLLPSGTQPRATCVTSAQC